MATELAETTTRRRWGWPEIVSCYVFAQIGAGVAFAAYVSAKGLPADISSSDLSINAIVLVSIPIWIGFLVGPVALLRLRGFDPRASLGMFMEWSDVPRGLLIGFLCQFPGAVLVSYPITVLFDVDTDEIERRARDLTDGVTGVTAVSLLVLLVVIMAPLGEEVFFRGLLHRTIGRSLGAWPTIVLTGFIFGATHFSLVQLPALVAFGVVLSYLVHRYGRLGPAIWAHVGFNAATVIVLLVA